MTDLIARLEAATGPSFILDTEIFCAVTGRVQISDIPGYTITEPNDGTLLKAPSYTASLDAARQLVPAAHEWSVGDDHENRRGWAKVGDDIWDECCNDITATAATPALALCIAALRARSTEGG